MKFSSFEFLITWVVRVTQRCKTQIDKLPITRPSPTLCEQCVGSLLSHVIRDLLLRTPPPPPLDGMLASPSHGYLAFCQYPFIHLGEERHCEMAMRMPHLICKNNSSAHPTHGFYISLHFFDVLVLTTT